MIETTFIYALIDPFTGEPKYIGKANNPKTRLIDHIAESKKYNFKKCTWIKSLNNKGLRPILEIIDEVLLEEWQFWECHYISLYKSWGFDLKNHDHGGLGTGRISKETRDKISLTLRGNIPWNKNITLTTKERLKLRSINPNKKAVIQFTLEDKYIATHISLAEAARVVGAANYSVIGNAIKSKKKISFGYKWNFDNKI